MNLIHHKPEVLTEWKEVCAFQFHPFYNYLPKIGAYSLKDDIKINSRHFRSQEIDSSQDTFNIYLSGDCTVFESHLKYEESFACLLQEELRTQSGREFRTLNAGLPHYSLIHCINRLIGDLYINKIDTVILHVGINDVIPFLHTSGQLFHDYSNYFKSASRDSIVLFEKFIPRK
ncbi:MAG: hypothetical protein ACE5HI_20690, partial [bacterium]